MTVISAVPLTPAAFAPYGSVLQNPAHYPTSLVTASLSASAALTVNQSTATKYPSAASFSQSYPASAPPAKLTTNIFVCKPRELLPANEDEGLPERYACGILEKHPYSPQSFVPLGVTPRTEASRYVVIVAPDKDGKPDWENLKAFLCHGSQGVIYAAGTWHSPMVVVGKQEIDFVVMVWENGVPEMDCVEVRKAGRPVEVGVPRGIGSGEGGLWGKSKL